MPELPEITSRAREMNKALVGKTLASFEIKQTQCLNVTERVFKKALLGATINQISSKGKWLLVDTSQGWLLINLGMGGEILLKTDGTLPKKHRFIIGFSDGSQLVINFWWFGYVHFAKHDQLQFHPIVGKLGPNILDLTFPEFKSILQKQRGRLKTNLLDQSKMAGIGNAYIHDILFFAKLHPLCQIPKLDESDMRSLFDAIHRELRMSLDKGGAFYELNLYGNPGGFTEKDIVIGYRDGKPCPVCSTPIQKVKTGSTSSFICPDCQKLV
jgi:formamidopyrimidine-DNA glycosylase